MIKKLIFATGAAVGYVLGTRAGRQRYEAMVGKARQVMERPDVKEATEAIQAQANRLYDEGRQKVRDRARTLRARGNRGNGGARLDSGSSYPPGVEDVVRPEWEPLSERR